ncbi:MAG: hypothetical protein ABI549_13405 [Flavobacterium sp.]|uniref:hypothetical protein n=1 Tax=Flavobacterium sp. TaxID=239 RepID=UPI0032637A4E
MVELFKDYIGQILILIFTAFSTWFITKRKQNADINTTEIDNGSKVVSLYKDALDDLSTRYEKKYIDVENQAKNIEILFVNKENLLMQEIDYHKKQTILYKKMYDDKVREFNKYKKEHP